MGKNKNLQKTSMQNSCNLRLCHIAWNNQKLPCQYQERQAKGVRIRKSAEGRKNICVRTTFVAQLSIKAKARFEPEIVKLCAWSTWRLSASTAFMKRKIQAKTLKKACLKVFGNGWEKCIPSQKSSSIQPLPKNVRKYHEENWTKRLDIPNARVFPGIPLVPLLLSPGTTPHQTPLALHHHLAHLSPSRHHRHHQRRHCTCQTWIWLRCGKSRDTWERKNAQLREGSEKQKRPAFWTKGMKNVKKYLQPILTMYWKDHWTVWPVPAMQPQHLPRPQRPHPLLHQHRQGGEEVWKELRPQWVLEVEVWEHLVRPPQVVGEVDEEEEMVAHPKEVHRLVELVSNLLLTWAPKALE